jgi:hypothetical protein
VKLRLIWIRQDKGQWSDGYSYIPISPFNEIHGLAARLLESPGTLSQLHPFGLLFWCLPGILEEPSLISCNRAQGFNNMNCSGAPGSRKRARASYEAEPAAPRPRTATPDNGPWHWVNGPHIQ